MANDIYGRTVEFGNSFASDKVTITFSGFGAGLLAQNVGLNYSQQVNRIWELGSRKTYFVGGRTAGTLQIATIAGPSGTARAFVQKFGNVCNANSNTMTVDYGSGWCTGGVSGKYVVQNAVIQGISVQVSVNDMLLNESVQGIFNALTT